MVQQCFLPTSDTQLPNKFCLDYIKYNQTPDTQNTAQHRGGILYIFLISWTCLSHLHLVVHVHCQTYLQTCYAFCYCQKKYTTESMYIFFSLSKFQHKHQPQLSEQRDDWHVLKTTNLCVETLSYVTHYEIYLEEPLEMGLIPCLYWNVH